jgi:hypothetical protein
MALRSANLLLFVSILPAFLLVAFHGPARA